MGTKLGDMLAKKASGASVKTSESKPAQYLIVPIDRLQPESGQPLLNLVGIRIGFIDLIDRDDDRDTRSF